MDQQDQRDELFERAKVGEITGEEADAEAIRLGLGSLSHQPGPDEFRPEAETQWTLVMAVAWIAYLDLDEVREWSAPYRAEYYHWLWQRWRRGADSSIYEGWHLEQRSRPSLSLLGISDAARSVTGSKPPVLAVSEAEEALWVALREGLFSASGIDTETGRRVEIPTLDWRELVAVENRGQVDEVRRGLMASGYREVLVPSAAVRGFWHRRKVMRPSLPQLVPPTGHGYMPLFCAAQWIATEGGARDFDPADAAFWQPAYGVLLAAIASEKLRAIGVKGGQPEPVPPYLFAGIRVDYPFSDSPLDMILSDDLILRSYPYINDEHWRDGSDDALVNRRGDHWRRLMVEKGEVGALWPFELRDRGTGTPGRPTKSIHLILDEFERRIARAETGRVLREEATALIEWLKIAHPFVDRPTRKTVENRIRSRFRSTASAPK